MAELPPYLTRQTITNIRNRLLDNLPDDIDKSQGSFAWDILSPVAVELAEVAIWIQQAMDRIFLTTTFGDYLDLRGSEYGLTRNAAKKAKGIVTFEGLPGTVIPAESTISTISSRISTTSVSFKTTTEATITGTTVDVPVVCVTAGSIGNVPSGTVTYFFNVASGLIAVYNNSAMSGGEDTESDDSFRYRILQRIAQPPTSANAIQFSIWANEVNGVGRVYVKPVEDGPGTVGIYIVDSNFDSPSQDLIDMVQDYIAPPYRYIHEAEDMFSIVGNGEIDTVSTDDFLDSIVFNVFENLCTNGDFKTNTNGWTTSGTNTISSNSGQAKFGKKSLLCTYQDNLTLASYAVTLTAEEHYVSAWIYIPTAYDGTQVRVQASGFTSATGTITENADMLVRDEWQRVIVGPFTPDGGDLSGSIVINDTGAPTAGRTIYVDGVAIAQDSLSWDYTTYLTATGLEDDANIQGIWNADLLIKVNDNSGTDDLLNIHIWNDTDNEMATVSEGGLDAESIRSASDFQTYYSYFSQPFYFNSGKNYSLHVERMTNDTSTLVSIDRVRIRSAFSAIEGNGKSPIGWQVYVKAPIQVNIDVAAEITYDSDYDPDSVKIKIQDAIYNYFDSLVLLDSQSIIYNRVVVAILDVPGVLFTNNVTINEDTQDIPLEYNEIPVLGATTWT